MTSKSEQTSNFPSERDDAGRFPKGVSGNPAGRPKGSKNRVTMLKLMAEEAVREGSQDKMLQVARLIIEQALDGDRDSQKLVWNSIMSKGVADNNAAAKDSVQITITSTEPPKAATVIDPDEAEEADYADGNETGE